ncbi:MAG: hypothetical protein O6945_07445 [Gammaproteobacteria bacterium]|nr:hypothetical protein [Gammaproteobacteria bacterium]
MRIAFIFLLLAGTSSLAESPSPTTSDYTVCAVYHRMMVGSFQRSGRDWQAMAEREKMDSLIKKAKHLARDEYGDELAEELFLDEWRAVLARMNDQINRNYKNISRLKYRYKNRCTALHENPD